MKHLSLFFLFLCVVPMSQLAVGQTSYPMLMSLRPVAAQVGKTSEHTIKSRYSMLGAYQVLVSGEGVAGEIVPPELTDEQKKDPPNLQEMKVNFTVSPEAMPGVREFRIATPNGVSTIGQLVIVQDNILLEASTNDQLEQAQEVTVPATLCGAIEKAEDVDYFKFNIPSPLALSFHVRAMRLQDKIHDLQQHCDPILTIRSSNGATLVASDNYFYGDPFIGYQFEQAGEYFLELRDVRYQGNQYWEYSIEISDQPFVSNVFPLAAARGQESQFQLVGFNIGVDPMVPFTLPVQQPLGAQSIRLPYGDSSLNPVPVSVTDLPTMIETSTVNNTANDAQIITAPVAINGRIEAAGDIDYYAFEAKKGETYSVEVVARRQQSALDCNLRILNDQGNQLSSNDDMQIGRMTVADSQIENWTAPADGKFFVEIRDLHLRGGHEFIYFIKLTRSEPYFELLYDTDKTLLTPGTNGVMFLRVTRKNGFAGEITLHIDGLPPGVTAHCGRILPKRQDACIILRAENEAAMSVSNITVTGASTMDLGDGRMQTFSVVAQPLQEIYMPGGGRSHWPVGMHTVSIGQPGDIRSVQLGTTELTMKPGESQKIDVTIERAEGFDANVTLDVLYQHLGGIHGNPLPEGIEVDKANSKTLLTSQETQGHITLKAAENAAPVERQQIAVMANISINFVMKTTFSSQPVFLSVATPDGESVVTTE
ncbi:MAG: hypothetical protein MK165_21070 [Pirellulaceae bacterium]|nr:hypothetical protein [Pirellulaceae bacterium]